MRELDAGAATVEKDYPQFHYRIFRLAAPLAPGEQRTLRFATTLEERGFPNGGPLTRIVANGTFLNNVEISPMIGMGRDSLLTDRSVRRRNGLPSDLRPPKLEDTAANAFPAFFHESDWAHAEIAVTTDADQTPLAPGYTVSDEIKNGRRTLVTRTEAPIMTFFSIQSARYAIARDVWQARDGSKVNLGVYYHPDHEYNVARIIQAMKASLDVFSERFGPYQFRQVRILEFPAYETFAQSFANTIPFSEGIGFVQTFDDKAADSIDQVTFVTAHELGHQWWGHQVIGADKQGAAMLSETFAQYSALLVMEKIYGHEQIRKFLKSNLDDYLRNRGAEVVEELPLERVETQPYIYYRKGALVMYWLKETLGEDVVDRALRRLLASHAFKGAPYPSTTDFLAVVLQEAGPGHEKLVNDLFANITLYDLKARDAVAHKRADGRYDVRFTVEGKKLYADPQGKERAATLDEPMDVGAFLAEPGKKGYRSDSVLKVERVPIKDGAQTLTLVVDKPPKLVGIDPFNERIDRNSDDNFTSVKVE
jgi:aminopeptidase N